MSRTLQELAEITSSRLIGDGSAQVSKVASLAKAQPGDLVFVQDAKSLEDALASRASAVIAGEFAATAPSTKPLLISGNPRLAFCRAGALLHPPKKYQAGVHPTAVVHSSAKIAKTAAIDAHAVVGAGAVIGERSHIGAGCSIGENAAIGRDCDLYPCVVIYHGTTLGNRVVIHAGAVLGSDGFGYVFDAGVHRKVLQVGHTVIGDDVEIGEHCILCAQVGIAGSAKIGNYVVMAGQVGIAGHLKIGNQVTVGSKSGVMHNIPDGETWLGMPAQPDKQTKRIVIAMQRLPDLLKKVAQWEKKLAGE